MLETPRLVVARVALEHAAAQLGYYARNAEHLKPWEPKWPDDLLTLAFWQRSALRSAEDVRDDHAYRFIAFRRDDPQTMVASINLSNVVRGVFAAAHLGYSVDAAHQGQGIGTEAVRAVVEHAFQTLHLHRLMGNYQPTNERSGRLLRRLGFVVEGYARDYLFIAGAWRDHILTTLVNPDPRFQLFL